MNIFEKINAMPRGCGIRDVSVGRLDGLTTDDLKSLVSVIEVAEKALERYADKELWYTPKVCDAVLHGHSGHTCQKNCAFLYKYDGYKLAAEALKTIRTAKGEE